MSYVTAYYAEARRALRRARQALQSGEGVYALPIALALFCDALYYRHTARSARRGPVVFCDFDGVLNGRETREAPSPVHAGLFLHRACVERLNAICERTGARVVLTTSWRTRLDIAAIGEALKLAGFRGSIIGATPAFATWPTTYTPRREEIQAWLAEFGARSYVVLDDYEDASIYGQFVRCDTRIGLTDADVEDAVRILGERR